MLILIGEVLLPIVLIIVIDKTLINNKRATASTGPHISIGLENKNNNIKREDAEYVTIRLGIGHKGAEKMNLNIQQVKDLIFGNEQEKILKLSDMNDDKLKKSISEFLVLYSSSTEKIKASGG
jgi:hypothetical protein